MQPPSAPSDPLVLARTRAWVERAVVGFGLCPFAAAPQRQGRVRYVVAAATTADALLATFVDELRLLVATPEAAVETTLLIHPHVLDDFLDFNDFVGVVEDAIEALGLVGFAQVATFHPRYRFAEVDADDLSNATNRSPYPVLQLIRESSMDRAVAAVPDTDALWQANVATMERLGRDGWAALQARIDADAAAADADRESDA